jgi:hypothetical protein
MSLWRIHRLGRIRLRWWQGGAAALYVLMTLVVACVGAWLKPVQGVAGFATLVTGYVGYRIIRRGEFWGKPRTRSAL